MSPIDAVRVIMGGATGDACARVVQVAVARETLLRWAYGL